MATNEILQFAETDTGTNLLTQAEYLADAQRPIGNQPGVARSKLVNKALRQASLIAAGLAEYIADNQANNITDALTPQNIADYLQAAITGALGVTAPQFDNDASLATTAFVQRALGNRNGFYSYVVGTQLTAQHAGATVSSSSSSAISLNLPQIGSVVSGAVVEIINSGTGLLTVWPTAPDLLYAFGQAGTVPALNMEPGASMKFLSTGAGWVGFGSGQLKFDPDFKSSLAASGYQKLPSGLIIQWGTSDDLVTFPIAFPSAVYSIQLTPISTQLNGATRCAWVAPSSLSGFDANRSTPDFSFYWTAIGK